MENFQEVASLTTERRTNRGTLGELGMAEHGRRLLTDLLSDGVLVWLDPDRGPAEYGPDEELPLGMRVDPDHDAKVAASKARGGWRAI